MTRSIPIHLDERLVAEIARIGLDRSPIEACGILLPTPLHRTFESHVVELPNRSMNAVDSYVLSPLDIRIALESWSKTATAEERNSVVVWHTHPKGNIGPSSGDLRQQVPGATYLVVALDPTTGTPTPCWF